MFEPKIPVVGAVIGFALSFLIGLLSGAVFHLILARALGMGLLFGGLSFACSMLVAKFLPELLSGDSGTETRDPAMGSVVDVTLGDGSEPLSSFDDIASGQLPDFASAGGGTGRRFADAPTDVEDLSQDGFVPGLPVGGSFSAAGGAENAAKTGSGRTGNPEPRAQGRTTAPLTADGLDILPDLQDFVPAARPETDEDAGAGDMGFSDSSAGTAPSSRASREFQGTDVESATMVKAIRTLLSRDN